MGKRKILVVDDNRSCVSLLSMIMARMGFDVHEAYSGEEAIGFIDHSVDIVITDMHMGMLSGNDVARAAKALNKRVMTILCFSPCTVLPDVNLFDHVFLKPINVAEIMTALQSSL